MGTVAGSVRRCAGTLEPFARMVAARVSAAPLAFFDETGFRTQAALAALGLDGDVRAPGRAPAARQGGDRCDRGTCPAFRGVAMHDAWAPTTPRWNRRTKRGGGAGPADHDDHVDLMLRTLSAERRALLAARADGRQARHPCAQPGRAPP